MKIKFLLSFCFVVLMATSCKQQKQAISPRFNHVFLTVQDLDKSIAFYQAAFDMEVFGEIDQLKRTNLQGESQTVDYQIVLLRFEGQNFNLELAARDQFVAQNDMASYAHLGIDVADIEKASAKLLAAGATALRPLTLVEAGDIKAKTAFFTGPNGETLELMEVLEGDF